MSSVRFSVRAARMLRNALIRESNRHATSTAAMHTTLPSKGTRCTRRPEGIARIFGICIITLTTSSIAIDRRNQRGWGVTPSSAPVRPESKRTMSAAITRARMITITSALNPRINCHASA